VWGSVCECMCECAVVLTQDALIFVCLPTYATSYLGTQVPSMFFTCVHAIWSLWLLNRTKENMKD